MPVEMVGHILREGKANGELVDSEDPDVLAGPFAHRFTPGGVRNRYGRLTGDQNAKPMWARFYEIDTNRPFFCGRDGVKKYALAEIEYERRNGYAWLGYWPESLLSKDYPAWKARLKQY